LATQHKVEQKGVDKKSVKGVEVEAKAAVESASETETEERELPETADSSSR
jgi:hypothetical protein